MPILGSQQRTTSIWLRRLHAGVFYGLTGAACASHARRGKAGWECVECLPDSHPKLNVPSAPPESVPKTLRSDSTPLSTLSHEFA